MPYAPADEAETSPGERASTNLVLRLTLHTQIGQYGHSKVIHLERKPVPNAAILIWCRIQEHL
jgi:hypothetical protein